MNNYNYFIGIDVSKLKLDVCVLKGKKVILERCIGNTPQDLKNLGKELKKMNILPGNALLCCENTGIYTSNLMGWSTENGHNLWVEKAIQIKKSIGMQRGKNDQIDACRIAEYAFRYQDQAVIFQPPRKEIEELKHLLAMRQRFLKSQKQLKVALKELQLGTDAKMYERLASCSKNSLKAVEGDLKKVDLRIKQIIKEDENLSNSLRFATSVEGVGMITAVSLIVSTNEFKVVKSGKELACYAGVVPFPHQSGSSIRCKERVSHFANKNLKTLLHLCAISAKTHSKEIRGYYERKIAEGKHVMSVLNAVRNKIIRRVFACVKGEKIYEKTTPKNLLLS